MTMLPISLLAWRAGGSTGAVTAFNADANNRQLHPSEHKVAKDLAARSGGKYTVAQIEDAMRNSGNSALGEDINHGSIVSSNGQIRDDGAQFTAGQDGRSAVQVFPNGGQVDPQLAAFIQNNTGGSANSPYSWSPVQLGMVSAPVPNPNAGLNTMTPAGNGCVTAECAAGISGGTAPPPDYFTIQGGAFGASGSISVNLLNGDIFLGANKGYVTPGVGGSFVFGQMIGGAGDAVDRGREVSSMLRGGSVNAGGCVAIVCINVNQSIGPIGTNPPTAIEYGIGTPGFSVGAGGSVQVRRGGR